MSKYKLDSWDTLKDRNWENLLLGNGFSINIWGKFNYLNLLEIAQSTDIENRLCEAGSELFRQFNSVNFEEILKVLYHALVVDDQLEQQQRSNIYNLYSNVKKSLGASINYAHIPQDVIDCLEAINCFLREYKNIFTTNYDLIPYWAIMENTSGFKDYFWGANNSFDVSETNTYSNTHDLHYLHGAIHLVEDRDYKVRKLTASRNNSLMELFDLSYIESVPLFITEGNSDLKRGRIAGNDYLRYCFQKLNKITNGLVILGHSLNEDYDQHIIDAINESNVSELAISIWPHSGKEEIEFFMARLRRSFVGKKISFFDSTTHPLCSEDLKITYTIRKVM